MGEPLIRPKTRPLDGLVRVVASPVFPRSSDSPPSYASAGSQRSSPLGGYVYLCTLPVCVLHRKRLIAFAPRAPEDELHYVQLRLGVKVLLRLCKVSTAHSGGPWQCKYTHMTTHAVLEFEAREVGPRTRP